MKSFNKTPRTFKRPPNFVFMLLALVAAIVMWASVNKWNKVEAQVEVGLDYYGTPTNLMVTKGLVNKLTVRLKGPERLLRSIPTEMLHRALDLSGIKKGENRVPIGHDQLDPLFRAFDVIDIEPSRIDLVADSIAERTVTVTTHVENPLKENALTYENVTVDPSTVVIRGPEEEISKISELPITIRLDPKLVGVKQDVAINLDTPNFVTATPPSVRVHYTITSGRESITVECPIRVAGDLAHNYEVYPPTLIFQVEVPEALQKDKAYLGQLEATVAPPALKVGESKRMRPRIRWPEGMTPLTPFTGEVVVTRQPGENEGSNGEET